MEKQLLLAERTRIIDISLLREYSCNTTLEYTNESSLSRYDDIVKLAQMVDIGAPDIYLVSRLTEGGDFPKII